MAEAVTQVITAVDLVGVFFFAISGATLAARKGYDIVGSLLLALMVGTGGGAIRDLIVNQDVPAAFRNPWYLILPVLVSLAVFFKVFDGERGKHAVMLVDAVGLAVYCVVGTRIALLGGLSAVSAAVLGLVTALIGAAATSALGQAEWLSIYTMVAVMLLVLGLRVVSLRQEWLAPGAEITGETQCQRMDPDDSPPVPDLRDQGSPADPPRQSGQEPTTPTPQVEENAADRAVEGDDADDPRRP